MQLELCLASSAQLIEYQILCQLSTAICNSACTKPQELPLTQIHTCSQTVFILLGQLQALLRRCHCCSKRMLDTAPSAAAGVHAQPSAPLAEVFDTGRDGRGRGDAIRSNFITFASM